MKIKIIISVELKSEICHKKSNGNLFNKRPQNISLSKLKTFLNVSKFAGTNEDLSIAKDYHESNCDTSQIVF